ncbi:MAG: hypothetical protein E7Z91_02315 [Cyanobacteria bacterium SIG30]|nr:hypothetical protein [Cyanobacteria bacterium SIG30]
MIRPIGIGNINNFKKYATNITFAGKPVEIEKRSLPDYDDCLSYWEKLKESKYLDTRSDSEHPEYRNIRMQNYGFLKRIDKITPMFIFPHEKDYRLDFSKRYCAETGFPFVKLSTEKIKSEFKKVLKISSLNLNKKYNCNNFDVLLAGYSPICPVGLGCAYPASGFKGGYVILIGDSGSKFDDLKSKKYSKRVDEEYACMAFEDELYDNVDQHILSFNHKGAIPRIVTYQYFVDNLKILDKYADELVKENGAKYYEYIKENEYENIGKSIIFNKDIAKKIEENNSKISKEEAVDFAYLVETVIENPAIKSLMKADLSGDVIKKPKRENPIVGGYTNDAILDIAKRLQESNFAKFSNVTRLKKTFEQLHEEQAAQELLRRREMPRQFREAESNSKLETISRVIMYSSNDHRNKDSEYFRDPIDTSKEFEIIKNELTK